jgi:tRNA (Thr-GGU) A37 N-methylase
LPYIRATIRVTRDRHVQHPICRPADRIGLHPVRIAAIDELRVRRQDLEAIDGTPIVDVKSILAAEE